MISILAPCTANVHEHDTDDHSDLLPPAAARPILDFVASAINDHVSSPAAMTSGMRSLAHKAASLVWSAAPIAPSAHTLELFMGSFVSMTSYLGDGDWANKFPCDQRIQSAPRVV